MKTIIKSHNFQEKNHKYLQQLWLNAHFEKWEAENKREISSVERCRIRKKYKFPSTIWDGQETNYGLKVCKYYNLYKKNF